MQKVDGFIGVGEGLFAETFACELETEDGTDLDAILFSVELPDGTVDDRRYVPERTAPIVRIPRRSHVAIGHYECGGCGTTVNYGDKHCHECGARLMRKEDDDE